MVNCFSRFFVDKEDENLEGKIEEFVLFDIDSKVPQGIGDNFDNVYQLLRLVDILGYRLDSDGVEIKVNLNNFGEYFKDDYDNVPDAIRSLKKIMQTVTPKIVKEINYPKSHGFDLTKISIYGESSFPCENDSEFFKKDIFIEIGYRCSRVKH